MKITFELKKIHQQFNTKKEKDKLLKFYIDITYKQKLERLEANEVFN